MVWPGAGCTCSPLAKMMAPGFVLLAVTLLLIAAEVIRHHRYRFPAYGWLGFVLLAAAEALMFRGVESVATYFTAIAWTAYLLIADAAFFAIRGRSRLRNDPASAARMALLSIPLWLIFEAYNLRLVNWVYVGLPDSLAARWVGYAWAFATITPAILFTAELIESFGWWDRPARPLALSRATQNGCVALGAAFLALPLLLPRHVAPYTFGLVWLGFLFFLDPINFRLGLPALEADLAAGRRGRIFSLLLSGWTCGWLWEFWNYWAAAKWRYIFPMFQQYKIFEMPVPGYLGFPPFALECFVMYTSAAALLGWQKPATHSPERTRHGGAVRARTFVAFGLVAFLGACLWPGCARAAGLDLPPAAERGLNLLYSGQSEAALREFRQIETDQPAHPLGYLLEAEARWWQIYCEACEIKWNMVDAWNRPSLPADDAYFALTGKGAGLAEASIAKSDSAEMQFYAGMAYALRARLTGLRGERRATARAGVRARGHFLRCLELDPDMTDAYTGIGLYNYYVDTLSSIAKVLRFFMGIPGGDKKEGIRQLEIAALRGTVTRAGARFYLAKNLRTYDLDYARSIEVMTPLVAEFPKNPIFQIILADTQAKLNHQQEAEAGFRAAASLPIADPACAARIQKVAAEALAALTKSAGSPQPQPPSPSLQQGNSR
jgi:hypothetical protein